MLGGGGFIGRNIVAHLIERGDCIVTAADIKAGSNWHSISSDQSSAKRFRPVVGDFTDVSAFNNLHRNFDEVYMLAAIVGVNRTLQYPQDVIRTNTLLTLNTLNICLTNQMNLLEQIQIRLGKRKNIKCLGMWVRLLYHQLVKDLFL